MSMPSPRQRTLIANGTVVTMEPVRRVLPTAAVEVEGNSILAVHPDARAAAQGFAGEIVDATGLTVIPGFVQTHVHLCQTLFRGLADDLDLIDWLRLRIFPFEAAHTATSMAASARAGIAELLRSGTTTVMDMGSVRHEEEIVAAIAETGLRAFVGKSLIDLNELHPPLKESTRKAIETAWEQARAWHGSHDGRIRYAVAPRFVLSCTDELLREAHAITRELPGVLFHSHAAENGREMEAVRARCRMDNVEYFDSIGVLDGASCLAHCVRVNEREVGLLAEKEAGVLHCPSSNLKLGSGIAPVPALLARGVKLSLGADGAPCNNSLDMFHEMRLAAVIQKPAHGPAAMPAAEVFAMATIGGARVLGMEREIGSIETGKKADLVLLDLDRVESPYDADRGGVYGSIVYAGSPGNVVSTMIDGRWVYRNRRHLVLDPQETVARARGELRKLLARLG